MIWDKCLHLPFSTGSAEKVKVHFCLMLWNLSHPLNHLKCQWNLPLLQCECVHSALRTRMCLWKHELQFHLLHDVQLCPGRRSGGRQYASFLTARLLLCLKPNGSRLLQDPKPPFPAVTCLPFRANLPKLPSLICLIIFSLTLNNPAGFLLWCEAEVREKKNISSPSKLRRIQLPAGSVAKSFLLLACTQMKFSQHAGLLTHS